MFHFASTAGVAICTMAAQGQVVLYDTLWITDDEVMDAGTGNAIGGFNGPTGENIDSQLADDFVVDEPVRLTKVVVDIMSFNGTLPAEGIWVQLYQHDEIIVGPDEACFADVIVEDYVATKIDTPLNFDAWRFELDVSHADIQLSPQRWWINAQPLDEFTTGDWFWIIGSVSIPTVELSSHVRDSFEDHGNNYAGLWGSTDWIPHDFRGNNTVSMRIEGEIITGCAADIDGDGDADADDFFGYLDLFAGGDGQADIDGDGDLDAEDFFGYLDRFAQGC